jgi:hypothetical protein
MTSQTKSIFGHRLAASILVIVIPLLAAGCQGIMSVPGGRQPPTTMDIAELGSGSLKVEVIGYSWSYLNGGSHVSISGTVANNTGGPIQGVTLLATLYDQNGSPLAYGETYVNPTFLKEGGTGAFEFVALIKRSSGVKATRLITVARPLSGY